MEQVGKSTYQGIRTKGTSDQKALRRNNAAERSKSTDAASIREKNTPGHRRNRDSLDWFVDQVGRSAYQGIRTEGISCQRALHGNTAAEHSRIIKNDRLKRPSSSGPRAIITVVRSGDAAGTIPVPAGLAGRGSFLKSSAPLTCGKGMVLPSSHRQAMELQSIALIEWVGKQTRPCFPNLKLSAIVREMPQTRPSTESNVRL